MKRTLASLAIIGLLTSVSLHAEQTKKHLKPRKGSPSRVAFKSYHQLGVLWEPSLKVAKRVAGERKSLIYFFALLGELDGGC